MASVSYKTSPWQWTMTTTSSSTAQWLTTSTTSYSTSPWEWTYSYGSNTATFTSATQVWYEIEQQTEEERAAAEEVRRQQQAEQARRAEENRLAQQRAETLLLEHLDETETERWKAKGEIHVRSQRGRRYCIRGDKRQHNIFELDESDTPVKELCVHISAECPLADNVLAQKLALEHAEDHLLEKANTWDLVGGRRAR